MNERIRWGVLGNATIARICVIPAIQKSRNGTVQALASRSPDSAAETVRRHRIPRLYDNYAAVLEDHGIDAVYIPLPNHLHRPWSLAALAAGKPVLCEKPMACNAREAEVMVRAASDAGQLLMEALMYRFHPRSRRIRQLVIENAVGPPRLVRTAFCYRMSDALLESGSGFRLSPETGGGALLDVGCYGVSLARWLFGGEPLNAWGQAVYHASGVDIQLVGGLSFENGAMASLEVGFVSALQQTYSVIGSEGAIDLPHDAFIPWEKDARFHLRETTEEAGRDIVTAGADEYQLMVEHFADVLHGAAEPLVTSADSIANLKALDALARAARNGKNIAVTS